MVGGFILLGGILGKLKIKIEILRFGHSQTPDRDIIIGILIIFLTLVISSYYKDKKEKEDEKDNDNASS